MSELTSTQHTVVVSLYELTITKPNVMWFVKTHNLNVATIKTLYKNGWIETDKAINNVPTRFRLTEKGIEYGRQHYRRTNKRTLKFKNRADAARYKYDRHDAVTRGIDGI